MMTEWAATKPKQMTSHPEYLDCAEISNDWIAQQLGTAVVSKTTFPSKLHILVERSTLSTDHSTIVSWMPHGRAFKILDKQRFVKEVMPLYFPQQTEFLSCQRQLNIYGFLRINGKGPDQHCYYHRYFLRGKPELAMLIARIVSEHGRGRRSLDPRSEPDFYSLPSLPELSDDARRRLLEPARQLPNSDSNNSVLSLPRDSASSETAGWPSHDRSNSMSISMERAALPDSPASQASMGKRKSGPSWNTREYQPAQGSDSRFHEDAIAGFSTLPKYKRQRSAPVPSSPPIAGPRLSRSSSDSDLSLGTWNEVQGGSGNSSMHRSTTQVAAFAPNGFLVDTGAVASKDRRLMAEEHWRGPAQQPPLQQQQQQELRKSILGYDNPFHVQEATINDHQRSLTDSHIDDEYAYLRLRASRSTVPSHAMESFVASNESNSGVVAATLDGSMHDHALTSRIQQVNWNTRANAAANSVDQSFCNALQQQSTASTINTCCDDAVHQYTMFHHSEAAQQQQQQQQQGPPTSRLADMGTAALSDFGYGLDTDWMEKADWNTFWDDDDN